MKFTLLDRVTDVIPGQRLCALKAVSLSEEYLGEHFPTFPVLPGVFMLQALVEAASWLVRESLGFSSSLILLHSVKGVTYKSFVAPGHVLRVEVQCRRLDRSASDFTGTGSCDDAEVVKGRFALSHANLADRSPDYRDIDRRLIEQARKSWSLLRQGAEVVASPGS